MLVRAARRNLICRRYVPLHVCPLSRIVSNSLLQQTFIHRRVNSTIASSPQSLDPLRHRTPRFAPTRTETRSLATVTEFQPTQQDFVPFDGLPSGQQWHANSAESSGIELFDNDPSDPFVIRPLNGPTDIPPYLRRNPANSWVGGTPLELHQNLHASLRVRRFDRAQTVLRRMGEIYNPGVAEFIDAHNVYLGALLDALLARRPGISFLDAQSWFDTEMGKTEPPLVDATSIILMVRICMTALDGAKRDRAVRKYVRFAELAEPGTLEIVLGSELYTPLEWDHLLRLFPNHLAVENLEPDSGKPTAVQDLSAPDQRTQRPRDRADDFPEVRSTPQKGLGLKELQKALDIFSDVNKVQYPHDLPICQEERDKLYAHRRQLQLERDITDAAVERWRQEHDKMEKMGVLGIHPSLAATSWKWYTAILAEIKPELESIREILSLDAKERVERRQECPSYGPFIEGFSAEKIASATILGALQGFSKKEWRFSSLTGNISSLLESEAAVDALTQMSVLKGRPSRERLRKLAKVWRGKFKLNQTPRQPTTEEALRRAEFHLRAEWPQEIRLQIGAYLLEKLIRLATLPVPQKDAGSREVLVEQPAFSHSMVRQHGKTYGVVTPHDHLVKKTLSEPPGQTLGTPLPMLVPPLPWAGYKEGGYLTMGIPAVRHKKDRLGRLYSLAAIERGDLKGVFAGLDVLGKTPWRVNKEVLRVVIEAWNTGEEIGKLAPLNWQPELPPKPTPEDGPGAFKLWVEEVKRLENLKGGYHSQRCFQNFQLEVARAFRNEILYFPHSIDFRGRAYPIPPILNHMGNDLARSLMLFGVGKELGTDGLFWLKVHLSNLYGYDKASLKEREGFVMQHLDDIRDSTTNPFDGKQWWLSAGDPWQCLAACFELVHALDSPDPARYVSHLPIHQDGSCNGLQHYAALGGDVIGATQVNLEPGDRPSDIYSAVARMVEEEVDKDAAKGNPFAVALQGKIQRKVVKQPIMTNVYGVTFHGASEQVLRQLEDIMVDFKATESMKLLHLSSYIARHIFKSLASMFTGAHAIQYWLSECAVRISNSLTPEQVDNLLDRCLGIDQCSDPRYRRSAESDGLKSMMHTRTKKKSPMTERGMVWNFLNTVTWTTPLKLPVAQPYRKEIERQITVSSTQKTIKVSDLNLPAPVSCRKQAAAFPPNFIHSLDASHMMLSAVKCDEVGLTFAAVHDSFWTHAADVPSMNRILRDAFVKMHSEDIVGRLAEEFKARYGNCMYMKQIPRFSRAGQALWEWRKEQRKAQRHAQHDGLYSRCRVVQFDPETRETGPFRDGVVPLFLRDLFEEKERQLLLKSEDPVERERGRKMVTPASIFESFANDPEAQEVDPSLVPDKLKPDSMKEDAAASGDGTAFQAGKEPELGIIEPRSADAGELDDVEAEIAEEETDASGEGLSDSAGAKKKTRYLRYSRRTRENISYKNKISFWVPFALPEVPRKGDWDVSRLLESTYFFH